RDPRTRLRADIPNLCQRKRQPHPERQTNTTDRRPMRFRRIQSQILLIAIVPLFAMTVLAGAYLGRSRHLLLEEKLMEEGRSAARYVALASEYGLLVDDKQALDQIAGQALQDANIVRVMIGNDWDEAVVDMRDGTESYYSDIIVIAQPVFTR